MRANAATEREPWAPDERRDSKLVFIGRGLPKAELVERLERCLVT